MVRAAPAGQLTSRGHVPTASGVRFGLATPEHDAPLRRLLRENAMPGSISLTMEREPNFFAAAGVEGPEHQTIVAVENDRVVAAGNISARQRFINGQAMRVGYLGALRLDASCRGHASILRRGYEAFRKLHEQLGPPIYLTSIVADNLSARRFLEKGLSGMPTYRFLGEFVTLIIPRAGRFDLLRPMPSAGRKLREQGVQIVHGAKERSAVIEELLNRDHQRYQFAPVWSAGELHPDSFQIAYAADGRPLACAAIWDQRSVKQIVVRGYSGHLRWAKPLVNLAAAFLGSPRLPRIGMPMSHAFLSHLAFPVDQPQVAAWLIHLLRGLAHSRSIDYLVLGFDSRDPRFLYLRRIFRSREYVSRIYVVHWEDGAPLAQSLDGRLLGPEVATL